ncbi:MAG: PA14 domain-containing protein, partial [Candidatus Saccharibacteria bacterium]|nr:PA14 domain-containing protein [Candidatus Saccharibacteria bacterium]
MALFFMCAVLVFSSVHFGLAEMITDLFDKEKKQLSMSWLQRIDSGSQKKGDYTSDDSSGVLLDRLELGSPARPKNHQPEKELLARRTATTKTFVNKDGSHTLRYSMAQLHYQDEQGRFHEIRNTFQKKAAATAAYSMFNTQYRATVARRDVDVRPTVNPVQSREVLIGDAGSITMEARNLGEGISLTLRGKTITLRPQGARKVQPEVIAKDEIAYKEAWPGVDIHYLLKGESVKELLYIKSKSAATTFSYDVTGASLYAHPTRSGELAIKGIDPDQFSFGSLSVSTMDRGVVSWPPVGQEPTASGMRTWIDSEWVKQQPESAFPIIIDPTLYRYQDRGEMRKSDGYACNASRCFYNTGTLWDRGWKHWRTYLTFDQTILRGKKILQANLHMPMRFGVGGFEGGRWIEVGYASCLHSFHCIGGGPKPAQVVGGAVNLDITALIKWRLEEANDPWSWYYIKGEEGGYKSYKPFVEAHIDIVYDTPTPQATPISPADKAVIPHTHPQLRAQMVGDSDGATRYYFRVATGADAETEAIINSGWIESSIWTVPEGILQDGQTYYWRVYTKDAHPYSQTTRSNWVRSFKVDLRTGLDTTQAFDTVGPVSVNLATGNATLQDGSHSMHALGGDMGVSLSYNLPNRSTSGLQGEYWNVSAQDQFESGPPQRPAQLKRIDGTIDFDWKLESPDPRINKDHFHARWTGHLTVPKTGDYTFGAEADDYADILIDGRKVLTRRCCSGSRYDGSTSIRLEAGRVYSVQLDYREIGVAAQFRLFAKGAVNEQIVPEQWLHTPVQQRQSAYGLNASYYTDNGQADIENAVKNPSRLILRRIDHTSGIDFGTGGPAPGVQVDNFMARWTGYLTVPKTGEYEIGALTDDGIRMRLGTGPLGAMETKVDSWRNQRSQVWGSKVRLEAGKYIPIEIDWYERGSGATMQLTVRGNGYPEQTMPVTWLTPQAQELPDGWRLHNDAGGAQYDRITVRSHAVLLHGTDNRTHEYTWTGSGYAPPKNEDGVLTRLADGRYSLTDTDGRVYIFAKDGRLTSLTTPADDKKPADLKYEYAGAPVRLTRIIDRVNESRKVELFYKGINHQESGGLCDASTAGEVPMGMLCGVQSSDGDTTRLVYINGNIAYVIKPGAQATHYAYDSLGRITVVRDSLAHDLVNAGLRTANGTINTTLTYDAIGRVDKIIAPAVHEGGPRLAHRMEYLHGGTKMHIEGASQPRGFSKYVEYDHLYRTIKETDLTGKTITKQWHADKDLLLAITDARGLKTTTIYNDDDVPIEQYGPAPQQWFGADGRPLPAHRSAVPHTETRYDEGLKGPAVAWYGLKSGNMTLHGTPKAYTTGFASNNAPENGNPAYLRHDFRHQALPATVDTSQYDGYGFVATGKLRFPHSGTYTLEAVTDDSVRLLIDDRQILGNWGTKTQGERRNTLTGTFHAEAGKVYRFQYQYGHEGMSDLGAMGLAVRGPGLSGDARDWSRILAPGYNLQTTQRAFGAQAGDVETKTVYKNPAYGQVEKTILDPQGLNYQSQAEHEAPGVGYLRQTSKTLPGGAKTTYLHYGAGDMVDNPCTPQHDPAPQAGRAKGKIEPDPDGDGPQQGRRSETIYNHGGDVVATRYNDDPWTCTEYDARGRVVKTVVPDRTENGQVIKGRTITNNYAVDGNPLITSTTDASGTITVENDLLGRTVKYTDAKGHVTVNQYDAFGKLTWRTSPLGTESYDYDEYDRL